MISSKFSLVFLCLYIAGNSFAQNTSCVIRGTVLADGHKKPLTEAVITLTSESSKKSRIVLTDSLGNYNIHDVCSGNYSITFEMEGYKTVLKDHVTITAGAIIGVNVGMAKGKTKEQPAYITLVSTSKG